jgi:hypothetical protein
MLEYDDEKHLYMLDGKPIPGVSDVLQHAGLTSGFFRREDAERGRDVHEQCELINRGIDGYLSRPEVEPYVNQYRLWKEKEKPEILEVEKKVYHPTFLYAGRLDIVIRLDKKIVTDIKSQKKLAKIKTHFIQAAGYAIAYARQEWMNYELGVLYLTPTTYFLARCSFTDQMAYGAQFIQAIRKYHEDKSQNYLKAGNYD